MKKLAWLNLSSAVTSERVNEDVLAIVAQRFPRLITLRSQPLEWLSFFPSRPVFGIGTTLWKRGVRISFTNGGTDWSVWAMSVVRAELGVLYEGECGDERVDLTWTPDPSKWPTYESFVRDTHRREIERRGDGIVLSLLADVPEALR